MNTDDVKDDALADKAPAQVLPTFGEQLVGISFNPAADDKVAKAKRLCADLADLLHGEMFGVGGGSESSQLKRQLYDHTVGEILNAQMNVVKVLTLKY